MNFRLFEPKLAARLGALAPICAVASIGVSIALSPWFNWSVNALSDLGVSEAAPVFNLGLMLTGLLISVFAVALVKVERGSRLGLLGSIALLSAGVSAAAIGVFTEAYIRMHLLVALWCGASLFSSTLLFGIRFALKPETRIITVLTLAAIVLNVVLWSFVIVSIPQEASDSFRLLMVQLRTEGETMDLRRIGELFYSHLATEYNIRLPGIGVLEALSALLFFPWYTALCIRVHRNGRI